MGLGFRGKNEWSFLHLITTLWAGGGILNGGGALLLVGEGIFGKP